MRRRFESRPVLRVSRFMPAMIVLAVDFQAKREFVRLGHL